MEARKVNLMIKNPYLHPLLLSPLLYFLLTGTLRVVLLSRSVRALESFDDEISMVLFIQVTIKNAFHIYVFVFYAM
jgi:hypothetical protein